jgi:hypothetical protein
VPTVRRIPRLRVDRQIGILGMYETAVMELMDASRR